MAVLSDNASTLVTRQLMGTWEVPLAGYTNFAGGSATHEVYIGSIMVCDVSDTDGYFRAAPLSSSTNAAAGDIFGGVSHDRVSVTSSDTGDGSKEATVGYGVHGFAVGSLAATDIAAAIYASDDQTITSTSTNNFWVGYLWGVDSTYGFVNTQEAFMRTTNAA